uniref:AAR2 splicing factor homolog n=1 Tax=Tetradesmus obliquus TaxID=3088 RepID=A0A383WLT7_TETOB|eukprot:jgi/Sobl393_1/10349/SZX77706.1
MSQQQPYSVQLDPDTARKLASHGATILLLDVPLGMPVGIDQQVFLTGPKFRGIKMLPPGVHFLSYQAIAKDGTPAPPVSSLLALQQQQVLVRRWDPATESFAALPDEDEEARYVAGVQRFDFDRELAPYDLNRYSQWVTLSCHISEDVLQELLPPCGELSIMAEAADPCLTAAASEAEKRLQQQLQEGRAWLEAKMAAMQVDAPEGEQQQQQQQQQQQGDDAGQQQQQQPAPRGGRCRYSQLPRLVKVPGLPAAQLTALNMDKTALLEQVIDRYNNSSSSSSSSRSTPTGQQQQQQSGPQGIEVLGELQFAFIAFVFGQSLEGFMQWKQLLVLLLGCTSGPLERHPLLFTAFLQAITAQLQFGLGLQTPQQQTPSSSSSAAAGGLNAAGVASLSQQQQQDSTSAGFGLAAAGGLVDELLPDSFLKAAFRGFFEVLQEAGAAAPAPLLAEARVLEGVLASGLGWDFRLRELKLGSDDDEGSDEDGPVVVELSEQQLAELEGLQLGDIPSWV